MLNAEMIALGGSEQPSAGDHPTIQSNTGTEGTTRTVERPTEFVNGSGLRFVILLKDLNHLC